MSMAANNYSHRQTDEYIVFLSPGPPILYVRTHFKFEGGPNNYILCRQASNLSRGEWEAVGKPTEVKTTNWFRFFLPVPSLK